jgi:hypothetical protein
VVDISVRYRNGPSTYALGTYDVYLFIEMAGADTVTTHCTCHERIECQNHYLISRKGKEERKVRSIVGKPIHIHSSLASASCSTT